MRAHPQSGPLSVGVVADTPRRLPALLREGLSGLDHLLHAGGIADEQALAELERVAPLAVVTGSHDYVGLGDRYPGEVELDLGGARILLTNMIGTPPDLLEPIRRRLEADAPDVVVYGHAPSPQVVWIGGTLFLNPGSAGGAGGTRPATFGLLEIGGPGRLAAHIVELGGAGSPPPVPRNRA
jgi:hypothetical protein